VTFGFKQFEIWIVLICNLLFAVISSVCHTISFNEKLGGSLWTNKSRLDTKYEWINVAELDVVVGPVKTIETNVNIKGFG
jgi:hypothetical protein